MKNSTIMIVPPQRPDAIGKQHIYITIGQQTEQGNIRNLSLMEAPTLQCLDKICIDIDLDDNFGTHATLSAHFSIIYPAQYIHETSKTLKYIQKRLDKIEAQHGKAKSAGQYCAYIASALNIKHFAFIEEAAANYDDCIINIRTNAAAVEMLDYIVNQYDKQHAAA